MKNDELIRNEIERELQKLTPSAAPEELIQRLESSLDRAVPVTALKNHDRSRSLSEVGFWLRGISRVVTQSRALPVLGTVTAMIVFGIWYFNRPTPGNGERVSVGGTNPVSGKQGMGLVKEDTFRPFEVENHLVDAADDGIIAMIGDVPFRRVRYQLIDSYTWKNDADGASIRMAVPREEILIIPVSTY